MDTPKRRALERIEHILDAMEELRHSNPSGTNSFETHAGRLAYGAVTLGEFNNLLKKVESEGLAKFTHHTNGYGSGWGDSTVEILDVDWNRFDKYYKEIKKELKDAPSNKGLTFNSWNLVNPFWVIYQLAKWLVRIIKNNKLKSAVITLLTLLGFLAIDYSLAWQNIKAITSLLGIEM